MPRNLTRSVAAVGMIPSVCHTGMRGVWVAFLILLAGSAPAQWLGYSPRNKSVGNEPWAVAQWDFNADGVLDLAVAERGSDRVGILLGYSKQFALGEGQPPPATWRRRGGRSSTRWR